MNNKVFVTLIFVLAVKFHVSYEIKIKSDYFLKQWKPAVLCIGDEMCFCEVRAGFFLICFPEFDVQGSVRRKYIRFDIFPTRCNFTQFI